MSETSNPTPAALAERTTAVPDARAVTLFVAVLFATTTSSETETLPIVAAPPVEKSTPAVFAVSTRLFPSTVAVTVACAVLFGVVSVISTSDEPIVTAVESKLTPAVFASSTSFVPSTVAVTSDCALFTASASAFAAPFAVVRPCPTPTVIVSPFSSSENAWSRPTFTAARSASAI